jgi:hypothetical protein
MNMEMQWKRMNGFIKAQEGDAKWMHALVFMWPNGYFVNIWTKHMAFKCNWVDLGIHLLVSRGLKWQDYIFMNVCILNNLHARQKWNEKKVFCCDPNLELTTKVRVCKGASQKWSLGVTFHAPRSVGECEGMNLHNPKWAPTLGIVVSMDFKIFKKRL